MTATTAIYAIHKRQETDHHSSPIGSHVRDGKQVIDVVLILTCFDEISDNIVTENERHSIMGRCRVLDFDAAIV
ncbi:hypothetical protein B296_00010134 [Ensete ventricosum]|uniref:Uncharacterized protein n=1 Tax=Ensete ventricosum TaxID=4639 RepID=A0A426ZF71_ENSVE|nr:hypothetical protein B296_00010134 [Ensete ventricosum]